MMWVGCVDMCVVWSGVCGQGRVWAVGVELVVCVCVVERVQLYTDLTRCTLAHLLPLSSDLSDSLDHSPNAFALAQGVCHKTELQ